MIRNCFVICLLALVAACSGAERDYLVGTLERDRIEIPAELSEPVVALHVHEGAQVRAGEPLLQLDTARAVAERDRLAALRDQAQRRLDELLRGPRDERIAEARAQLAAAEGELRTAERAYERAESLHEQGLTSAAQRDAARAAQETAAGTRDAARATLEALLEGTTVEELDQARAQLLAAEAALHGQEILLERLSVEAPRDAIVEALPYEAGSQPSRGATVAVLLASGAPYARVHVPAARRGEFTGGTTVVVTVPGFGTYDGRVRYVSSAAAFTPYFALTEHDRDYLSYAAEIELRDAQATKLPAGVPVEVALPARDD